MEPPTSIPAPEPSRRRKSSFLFIGLLLVVALIVGFLSSYEPVLVAAGVAVGLFLLLVVMWPPGLGLVFFFLIYTNTGAIAIKFHHIPGMVVYPLLFLSIAIPTFYDLLYRRQSVVLTSVVPWMLLYLATQAVGAIFSRDPLVAGKGVASFIIEGLGVYLLVTNFVRTQERLRQVIWVLLLAGVVLGGVPLFQQLTGTFDNNYLGYAQHENVGFQTDTDSFATETRQPRLAGAVGEKNRFSQVMLMLVPLAFFRFNIEKSLWLKWGAAGAGLLAATGCLLAFSRGAAIAFVITALAAVFVRAVKLRHLAVLALLTVGLLAIFPQYLVRLSSLRSIESLASNNLTSEENRPDGAIMGRLTVMAAAALVYLDHPIVGVGPGMYKYYAQEYGNRLALRHLDTTRKAHSLYFGSAAETGTLGLISLGAIFYLALTGLNNARHRWRTTNPQLANISLALLLALISYMASGLFLHFAYIRYFWMIMGVAGAACHISEELEKEELSIPTAAGHEDASP